VDSQHALVIERERADEMDRITAVVIERERDRADEVDRQTVVVIERETVNDVRSGQHDQAYRKVRKN
jgi:hypothetical protein